jgi:hypothetical protein
MTTRGLIPREAWGQGAVGGDASRRSATQFSKHARGAVYSRAGDKISKYPPAKPGALGCEPLKAVGRVADAAR